MYIGIWALKGPSCGAWICVLHLWFVILHRCGRLPFDSQLGWLGPLGQGADIGQSRAAVLPPSSGAARQGKHLITILIFGLSVSQPDPNVRRFFKKSQHKRKMKKLPSSPCLIRLELKVFELLGFCSYVPRTAKVHRKGDYYMPFIKLHIQ